MDENQRDLLLSEIRTDVAVIKDRLTVLADHEQRIRGLERFRHAVPGVATLALAASVVGIVLAATGS